MQIHWPVRYAKVTCVCMCAYACVCMCVSLFVVTGCQGGVYNLFCQRVNVIML